MKKVAKFEKVSFEQFKKDFLSSNITSKVEWSDEELREVYDNIKLPMRASKGSAGYDFFLPLGTTFTSGKELLIPTGIKCRIEEGWVLKLYPRSGHGFKFKLRLNNTVGIIDQDYYNAKENEGHIMIKMCIEKERTIKRLETGDAFAQGIFVEYGITEDDVCEAERVGGMGSTSR